MTTNTDSDGRRPGRPQPGQSAADHQHVGEEMRHPFGIERHEVAGDGHGLWRMKK